MQNKVTKNHRKKRPPSKKSNVANPQRCLSRKRAALFLEMRGSQHRGKPRFHLNSAKSQDTPTARGLLKRRQIAQRLVCIDAHSHGALEYLRLIYMDKWAGIVLH